MEQMAYCGLDCGTCEHREKTGCPGCRAAAGTMFWGECDLAMCCIDKGIEHCAQCDDFPCPHLMAYSYATEHGDNGRRIENLRTQQ
jgi:Protein of unknown function (DUF3795)